MFVNVEARCLLVPRFDPDYSKGDTPEGYSPKVKSLLPAATIKVQIHTPDHENTATTFVVTERDLRELIRALSLVSRQLSAVAATAPKDTK